MGLAQTTNVGLSLLGDELSASQILNLALKAEAQGLESVWLAEHLGGVNPFPVLGAIAAKTRRIRLGTGVVSAFQHHPLELAESANALSQLAGGRFVLGIGTGRREWVKDRLGLPYEPAYTRMKEYLVVLKRLLSSGSIDHEGLWVARGVRLLPKKPTERPRIYLGAVGDRMIELAINEADGLILSAASSLEYIKKICSRIRRLRGGMEIVDLTLLCIHRESRRAKRRIKPYIATLLSRPGRAELMLGHLFTEDGPLGRLRRALKTGLISEAARLMPDSVVDEVAVAGDREECIRRLLERFEGGVTTVALLARSTPMEELSNFVRLLSNKI
jgi:alkanesulfonate monooxygenase SsuD/methylene tetrahydromethanopterin reductase-like flavin-dependent oxidoreductase (luciferase family)